MRIVFMGTPECAVTILQKLLESPAHQIVAVVTQPDKPAGRGRVDTAPPVKRFAIHHQLPVLQPITLKDNPELLQSLSQFSADVFVVVAYGKILPPEILAIPRLGCINVHFSLLPKYRGAAPVQWAIINGEKTTGVTIIKMNERMDEGEILASEEVEILDDDDAISLTNILSCVGGELLLRVLEQAEKAQTLQGTPQNHTRASYAPKLKKEDGLLDWSLPNEKIICRIKGLLPWPCAFSYLNGKMIKIWGAEPISPEEIASLTQISSESAPPGSVVALAKGRGFIVRTGDGFLLMTKVQPQDKQIMSGAAFVNGGYVKSGDKFDSSP